MQKFMKQITLFDEPEFTRIINVASVPMRSPFRYPGGKTWLIPRVREWLGAQPAKPGLLLEPFAGGAIVGLTAAFEELAEHVMLVELDEDVAAVWQTVITDGEGPWLAEKIASFSLSEESVRTELAQQPGSTRERAWKTILKNRVQRGGILAPGAGLIRFGEAGRGLASRWYPQTLARRILDIHRIRARLSFRQGDGLQAMLEHAARADAATFIDPPYTAGGKGKRAGTRLYVHNELDHEALFALARRMAGNVLMTYDDDGEVRALAAKHGLAVAAVPMKSRHHAVMTELLIGRDLNWLKDDGRGA